MTLWLDHSVYLVLDCYLLEEEQTKFATVKGWLVWRYGDDDDSFDGEEFQLVENAFYFQIRFFERKQRFQETVKDFAAALDRLLPLAYPDLSDAERQKLAANHFADGLRIPSALKETDCAQLPESLAAAVALAVADELVAVEPEPDVAAQYVAAVEGRVRRENETYNDFFKDLMVLIGNAFPTERRQQRWARLKACLSHAIIPTTADI